MTDFQDDHPSRRDGLRHFRLPYTVGEIVNLNVVPLPQHDSAQRGEVLPSEGIRQGEKELSLGQERFREDRKGPFLEEFGLNGFDFLEGLFERCQILSRCYLGKENRHRDEDNQENEFFHPILFHRRALVEKVIFLRILKNVQMQSARNPEE